MKRYRRIAHSDRYQIQKYLTSGKAVPWIADRLNFHRSSIYREIKRGTIVKGVKGGTPKGEYSALKAHREFLSVFHDSRRGWGYRGYKIKGWVEDQIRLKLAEEWSPEQISQRLLHEHEIKISAEAIYKFIISCKNRGEELHKKLRRYGRRRKRFKRRSRYWDLQYKRRRSIDDRPGIVAKRLRSGDWERDLMLGKRGSGAVLVAVDRKTQLTILEKVNSTHCSEVNKKTKEGLKRANQPIETLTNDNGHEFGEFWNLETALGKKVYFTHPLCPWERGTVENTIGLLRQYIPKGFNMKTLASADLKEIERRINSRPRKILNFKTPEEVARNRKKKLIPKKKIEPLPVEYYERYYLTTEEIENKYGSWEDYEKVSR